MWRDTVTGHGISMDPKLNKYRPSPELFHACMLMMDRLKAGDPEALLLKDDLQHVIEWLTREPVSGIPDAARHRID